MYMLVVCRTYAQVSLAFRHLGEAGKKVIGNKEDGKGKKLREKTIRLAFSHPENSSFDQF